MSRILTIASVLTGLLVSGYLLLYAIQMLRRYLYVKRNGIVVNATVIAHKEDVDADGDPVTRPEFSFLMLNGEEVIGFAESYSPPVPDIGDEVSITYAREDPTVFYTNQSKGSYLIPYSVCIALAASAFFLMVRELIKFFAGR